MFDDDDEAIPRRPADELRRIARYQRWIVAVVLAQLGLWVGCILLPLSRGSGFTNGSGFALTLTVILGCVGGVYSFLIYWSDRNPIWAVVMGLASIPPFLGFLTLAAVNSVATRMLKTNGVPVGMFGADIAAIEDEPGFYDEDAGW
jgi:hypothetical protein